MNLTHEWLMTSVSILMANILLTFLITRITRTPTRIDKLFLFTLTPSYSILLFTRDKFII